MLMHKKLQTGVIQSIREVIPDLLATIPAQGGTTFPAVIKDLSKGGRPDMPFIVVDIDRSQKISSIPKNQYYSEELGTQVYVTEKQIPILIKCIGEGSIDILNELTIRMNYSIYRHKMNERTAMVFNRFTEIVERPVFLSSDFVYSSQMTAIFTGEHVWAVPVEEQAGAIEQVIADGEVFDTEADTNPVQIHIEEPTDYTPSV